MNHIFISYSRRDSKTVNAVTEKLREAGLSVWQDISGKSSGIPFSTKWFAAIEEALHNSAGAVVFRSDYWEKSVPCKKEYDIVRSLHIPCFEVTMNESEETDFTDKTAEEIKIWAEKEVYNNQDNDLRTWLLSSLSAARNRRSLNTGIPHYRTKKESDAFLDRLKQSEELIHTLHFDTEQPALYQEMVKFLKRAKRITIWDRMKKPLAAAVIALLLLSTGIAFWISNELTGKTNQHISAMQNLDMIHNDMSEDPLKAMVYLINDENDYGDYAYLLIENYADIMARHFPSAFYKAGSLEAETIKALPAQTESEGYAIEIAETHGIIDIGKEGPVDRPMEDIIYRLTQPAQCYAIQDGYLAAASGHSVCLIDMARGRDIVNLDYCYRTIKDLRFDDNGHICAVTEAGDVYVWDNPVRKLIVSANDNTLSSLVPEWISADGRLSLSADPEGKILVRETQNNGVIFSCQTIKEPLTGVWADEGTWQIYALGTSGTAYQIDASQYADVFVLEDPAAQKAVYDAKAKEIISFQADDLGIAVNYLNQ